MVSLKQIYFKMIMELPTYWQYKSQVDTLIHSKELTVDQGIIITSIYRNFLEGHQTNINYLMMATSLGWKEINWVLNGLVQRGAITKIDKKWYTIK